MILACYDCHCQNCCITCVFCALHKKEGTFAKKRVRCVRDTFQTILLFVTGSNHVPENCLVTFFTNWWKFGRKRIFTFTTTLDCKIKIHLAAINSKLPFSLANQHFIFAHKSQHPLELSWVLVLHHQCHTWLMSHQWRNLSWNSHGGFLHGPFK